VPPLERLLDRGNRLGFAGLARLGQELREARLDRGLTVDAVGAAAGISNASVSRIERAKAPRVPFIVLAKVAAVIGLDLVVRTYPGGSPLRDAGHASLLADLRAWLHRSLRWATEVPLPGPGDQRAWDAMIIGSDWRLGVEAETRPRDAQALVRRVNLKQRDGAVDGVLLAVRDSRTTREFLREAVDELAATFPLPGTRALELLHAGVRPPNGAVVLLPRRSVSRASRSPDIRPR
jgi:transcriptional regulator with XRE-family HTH domain